MYFVPYVSSSGLHIPTYQDILDTMISDAQAIYGADIYLGIDTQDYQFLSVIASKQFDSLQAVQLAYNNTCPTTAIGSGLSSLVKLNGIARKAASYSTCEVTLTGTASVTITNGVVQDQSGILWDLPASVTLVAAGSPIGSSYSWTGTATCETIGAQTALPATITTIATPTYGWASVTNATAAVPGLPVETDAQLRARQALSVSIPSLTKLDGTVAAIAAVANVTRYQVYENYTNLPLAGSGLPAHSITCVVEGGTDTDVATAIYNNRGIGCLTYGDVSVTITSVYSGIPTVISFKRSTPVPIYVHIQVHPLTGVISGQTTYTSADTAAIEQALTDYLNSLQIGEAVTLSSLYGAALSVMDNLSLPNFSIKALTIGKTPSPLATSDLTLAYNEVSYGDIDNITLVLV